MRNLLREVGSKASHESYSFFTLEQRKQFLEIYKESNAKVAQEYFKNMDALESLFSPIRPDKHKEGDYEGLTAEKAVFYLTNAIVFDYKQRKIQADVPTKNGTLFKKVLRKIFK